MDADNNRKCFLVGVIDFTIEVTEFYVLITHRMLFHNSIIFFYFIL